MLHSACFARRSSDLHSLSLLLHCNAALRWKCDSVLSTTGSVTPQGSQGSLHCATHMGGWGPSQDSLAKLARSSGQSKNLCWWRVNRVFLFWYLSLKYHICSPSSFFVLIVTKKMMMMMIGLILMACPQNRLAHPRTSSDLSQADLYDDDDDDDDVDDCIGSRFYYTNNDNDGEGEECRGQYDSALSLSLSSSIIFPGQTPPHL